MAEPADSVGLDDLAAPGGKNGAAAGLGPLANVKLLVSIFVIFVLVVSDVFAANVLTGFRGALDCRTPTSFGVVLQGVFLVIFYVLAIHLIDGGVV